MDDLVTLYTPRWETGVWGAPSISEMRARVPRDKAESLARTNRGWFVEEREERNGKQNGTRTG